MLKIITAQVLKVSAHTWELAKKKYSKSINTVTIPVIA
jgi:nicotinic acid mononucleotide adenylyltransferase